MVATLLGPTGYGTLNLVLLIPGLLQLFIGFGAISAVIRYSAYYSSLGREDEAKRFTTNVIIFLGSTGTILTLFCFLSAGTLSAILIQRPLLAPYVQLASLSILGTAALQTATAAAIGWDWMTLSGFTTITHALVKLAVSPAVILLGFGVTGALIGHLTSLFIAGSTGVGILYFRRLRGFGDLGKFFSDVKEMVSYGVPVYVGGVMNGLSAYFVLVILAAIASNTVNGYYYVAFVLTSPATILATAMVNALFPAFAAIDGVKADVNQAFRLAYKFVALVLTPLIVFMMVSAGPLIKVIYHGSFDGSIPYLQLLAFAYLPIAFGYTVHPAFFNGLGKTKLTFLLYLTASATLVIAAPLLALEYNLGVNGLIYANFLSDLVAWAAGTLLASKFLHANLDVRSAGAILGISALSGLATYAVSPSGPAAVAVIVNAVVFFGTYLTLAPLFKAINKGDLDLLEQTLREPALVGKIVSPVLRYEKFLVGLRERPKGPQTI
ncbi:MAG: oligosaccharide flippase family protein [Thaumarchaeota archaeon]|nr:oligosaccharide flippase family protein [Nitrososphaerota archaeon]